jgi:transcriptional regulator with XRE-family HTH domain/tetratricopeptide (TPR) repeat protein
VARPGKTGSKAERDALRQEMLVSGCSLELIASEMERRWGFRPREAYRHAHGWSQDEVAARFTEVADRIGGERQMGPDGRPMPAQAPMIGTRIGEYERWPSGGRRPSPYVLTVLATVLGTSVERLLDYGDHRKMPDQERTVLAAVLAASSPPVPLPTDPRPPSTTGGRTPLGKLTELSGPRRPGSPPVVPFDLDPEPVPEPTDGPRSGGHRVAGRRAGRADGGRGAEDQGSGTTAPVTGTPGIAGDVAGSAALGTAAVSPPDPAEDERPHGTRRRARPATTNSAGSSGTAKEPGRAARSGRGGPAARRAGQHGAVILPFAPEETDEPNEPDGPVGPVGTGPVPTGLVPGSHRPGDASPGTEHDLHDLHDDPFTPPVLPAHQGDLYEQGRLPQRVPRPVPPPLPDSPYIAVALDPAGTETASAGRRHRRDRLLADGGESVRSDEEVIMDAAGQSAEFGEWAEGTNVGPTTLEQFDEDVRRIARDYLGNPPLPLMLSALRVRNRVFTLLEGRQHPEQTRQLYVTAGRLCGLLAWMASDVGRHGEAETQARTAWLCAELAGSDGLRAWVRATQSKVAYWDGRVQESVSLAGDGLRFAAPDSARVMLASLGARAWARIGDADEAHAALHAAEEERERAGEDEVGGLLGFSEAQQSYMAGSTYLWLKEPKEALAAADRAVWLFDVGNQSIRFYGAEMLALVDAAAALVQSGDLDGAAERLRPVLDLPAEQQLDTFTSRLGELRDGLRRSRYAMSKPAVDIQRQIEEFRAGALGQILSR